jgi:hypothetical protein
MRFSSFADALTDARAESVDVEQLRRSAEHSSVPIVTISVAAMLAAVGLSTSPAATAAATSRSETTAHGRWPRPTP